MPNMIHRGLLISAGVCGFLGVLAGTFGAHGLKGRLADDMLATFEIGVRYHLAHAVALLAIAIIAGAMPQSKSPRLAGWFMTAGIAIFSGSLYVLAITEKKWLGMVTPFGGVAFLIAWMLLAVSGMRMARPVPH